MSRRPGALAAALALCACAPQPTLPARPVAAGPRITIDAVRVSLSAEHTAHNREGNFTYAGGLQLGSRDTSRLHGLSDLKVWPDGRLLAVTDEGDLFRARLALDRDGRLAGLGEAELTPLDGADGRPLSTHGKREADSEGIAELGDGTRLVSLERDDRILLYPADGGPPRRAPAPDAAFPDNLGMEALAADPATAPDAYLVGAESTGQTWLCRLSAGCAEAARIALPEDGGLTAVAPLPGGGRAYLLRAFSLLRGVRATVRITAADGSVVDELKLAAPLAVDNFEGLAALPHRDGGIRFYLLSDDNFSGLQRTLLLAFDWAPPPPEGRGRR